MLTNQEWVEYLKNSERNLDACGVGARGTERWRLVLDNRHELAAGGMSADTLKAGDRLVVTGGRARNRSRSLYISRLQRRVDGFLYEQVGTNPLVRDCLRAERMPVGQCDELRHRG